jgi:uncharacterized protein (TIGR02246 family)
MILQCRFPDREVVAKFFCAAAAFVFLSVPAGRLGEVKGADAQPQTPAVNSQSDSAAAEKAIRASADEFVKAVNDADAKAVAKLWSNDAEYTNEAGETVHGRKAIEALYTGLFKEHPGATISVTIESIRFLGPDIAIEKGIAKLKDASSEVSAARYTVVHARRDGEWSMVDCRDAPYVPGSNEDYLKGLEWLIGEWKAAPADAKNSNDDRRRFKFEWMCDKNFIKSSFTESKDDKTTLNGGQIIGWNPKTGRIVSLHFDSLGGFGNDAWEKDGSKWVIEAQGVFRDGSDSTSVNIITPIDKNSFTWQSVKRTLDGVQLPDSPPQKIVRVTSAK